MSRRPSRPLRPEERELWRRVASTVKPLDQSRRERLASPSDAAPAEPRHESAPRGDASAAAMRAASAPKAPADRGGEKRVRRGRVEVEARLDLHGLTEARARRDLLGFLARARSNGMRTVLVITGKGAGARALDRRRHEPWDPEASPLPGVLRRAFTRWMAEPDFAELASGYATAHRRHGGSGAFYVMLRR
ncbi:Smr/MutS family protein [Marinicauda salina]|nr:Smr/MutS family protein [Marinicauda salina]